MAFVNKIVPNLWFDGNAQDAVNYYISVFDEAEITSTTYYPHEGLADFQQELAGKPLTINFRLHGQDFTAINAGSEFKFSEAISLLVNCDSQEEIDELWGKLSHYPENEQCGWCKDKFGLSWQIVPTDMDDMMMNDDGSPDPKAFTKMMQMKKIIIADFKS